MEYSYSHPPFFRINYVIIFCQRVIRIIGTIGIVVTGNTFGGIEFPWEYRKARPGLAPVACPPIPIPERRGRATSPVAHLSVWFIPWAVAVSGARRGSSVLSLSRDLERKHRL